MQLATSSTTYICELWKEVDVWPYVSGHMKQVPEYQDSKLFSLNKNTGEDLVSFYKRNSLYDEDRFLGTDLPVYQEYIGLFRRILCCVSLF